MRHFEIEKTYCALKNKVGFPNPYCIEEFDPRTQDSSFEPSVEIGSGVRPSEVPKKNRKGDGYKDCGCKRYSNNIFH